MSAALFVIELILSLAIVGLVCKALHSSARCIVLSSDTYSVATRFASADDYKTFEAS